MLVSRQKGKPAKVNNNLYLDCLIWNLDSQLQAALSSLSSDIKHLRQEKQTVRNVLLDMT